MLQRSPAVVRGAAWTGVFSVLLTLAGAPAGAARSPTPAPSATTVPPPAADRSVIGIPLSGYGARLVPPTGPTDRAYNADCHKLIDPAFTGKCVVASSRAGSVAGVVEVEHGAYGGQERDLVWRRRGDRWGLALVHVFENPGLPTQLWRYDLRPGRSELIFVMPTALPGFGSELDVVEGNGAVSLYRFLGEGFADVPRAGDLVTYVPGATEARPADGYFDQLLIGWLKGSWRVVAQQFVPFAAAMTQHHGAFWAPGAVAAS
jgi:hypothetical protein